MGTTSQREVEDVRTSRHNQRYEVFYDVTESDRYNKGRDVSLSEKGTCLSI